MSRSLGTARSSVDARSRRRPGRSVGPKTRRADALGARPLARGPGRLRPTVRRALRPAVRTDRDRDGRRRTRHRSVRDVRGTAREEPADDADRVAVNLAARSELEAAGPPSTRCCRPAGQSDRRPATRKSGHGPGTSSRSTSGAERSGRSTSRRPAGRRPRRYATWRRCSAADKSRTSRRCSTSLQRIGDGRWRQATARSVARPAAEAANVPCSRPGVRRGGWRRLLDVPPTRARKPALHPRYCRREPRPGRVRVPA
jgi:hypothetical protein